MRVVVVLFLLSFTSLWADREVDDKTAETMVRLADLFAKTSEELAEAREVIAGNNPASEGENLTQLSELPPKADRKPAEEQADPTQEDKETAQSRESELAARLAELKNQFDELATGVRGQDLTKADEADLDPTEEVKDILKPLVRALKKATERPRETEMLREREQRLVDQAKLSRGALERLSKWKKQEMDGESWERVQELNDLWSSRKNDAEGQLQALAVQLEQQESEKAPILKPVSDAFGNFFKGRGLNVLKALVALIATWFLLRYFWRRLINLRFIQKRNHDAFGWRLIELSSLVASVLLSAMAALLVLYFSGDWLLLTLFLVFMVGLGWTAKNTIPKTFEQTKMLLNLGPVRKGERLTFEGVAWEVGTIGVYTELRNCELTGGLIRMSIKRLSTLRSRPHDPTEPWFPTKAGEWVLAHDFLGKVVVQTPEYVQLVRLGGARETYPTPDFLGAVPVNLSNSFRVKATFGIDYEHQAISTTEVADYFKAKLALGLVDVLADREHLNSVNVEFASAGASSLDYAIMADFKGDAADRYEKLKRAIQRICVDVCNEKGWGIPFTQITLHQAK